MTVLVAAPALAQDGPQNLDAGKTPAQLFASDCGICHKSPQGLARSNGMLGLEGFLREHYTSSRETAAVMAMYLRAAGDAPAPKAARTAKRPPKAEDGKEAKPASDKKSPGDAKPAAATSSGMTPAEAKPIEVKPAEVKPAEAKPVEAKPVEAKPVEAKPVEAKPAEPKSD
jgi:hypothetical protein